MKIILSVLFLFLARILPAQIVNERAERFYAHQKKIYDQNSTELTAFKPSFVDTNTTNLPLVLRKRTESVLSITPHVDLFSGFQNGEESSIYGTGFGGELNYNGGKWHAGLISLVYNSEYMDYQRDLIASNRVVPAMNIARGKEFITSNYTSAFINFKANDIFDFELGYGRNFIGDGYRSLLLSDAGNASPYLKINTKFWRLKYTNLFAAHQNIYNVEGETELYQKKYTATHFLDFKATKWLTIGLFESIVWQAKGSNYNRGFDPNYANPVIFYRPVEFSVGSSDNALVGTNVKITPFKGHVFYTQLLFDEFLLEEIRADINQWRNQDQDIRSGWWANKYAIQVGWTAFDLMEVKGLQTRVEFNLVRPYTYAHSSATQSYTNYNISLAHPLGANFHEFVSMINYQKERWRLRVQYNQSRQGVSLRGFNYGNNLQLSNRSREKEYENNLGQGIPVSTKYLESNVSYVLNKSWNATISLGVIWREQTVQNNTEMNNMVMLRFQTHLFNRYFDY